MTSGILLWLTLLVVFLIMETSTVALISLWFAAGSLAALVVCLCGGSFGLQVGTAVAVAVILLLALRPLVRRYFNPKIVKTNVDSIIGSQGLVTVAIDNVKAQGQVKLGAMVWTARSTTGDSIPEGTLVKADRVEGVKVFVTPVEVSAAV